MTVTVVGSLLLSFGCGTNSRAATDASGLDALTFDGPTLFEDAPFEYGDVDLGTAGRFAVLAGSAISNTGLTVVTGDVGTSPGTAIVGFPPGVVMDGQIYNADTVAAQAKLDLTTAYHTVSRHAGSAIPIPIDIGGMTLGPGLYVSSTSLEINTGDLTLDAQNIPGAVWVFQMDSSFTSFTGRRVILVNGARDTNVFWKVGSSATIGTYGQMAGNFLGMISITMQTGATLDGRVLTQVGAVTLESNTIRRTIPILL